MENLSVIYVVSEVDFCGFCLLLHRDFVRWAVHLWGCTWGEGGFFLIIWGWGGGFFLRRVFLLLLLIPLLILPINNF
jgi:hypothetical protein